MRVRSLFWVIVLVLMWGISARAELPEKPFTLTILGGVASMPVMGDAGTAPDWVNESAALPYTDAYKFAVSGFIEGTFNFHERAGVTLGFGYIRYLNFVTEVDEIRNQVCTLPDGIPITCGTIKFSADHLQIWPVYVGARYYLMETNQDEDGIYIRADIGAVFYRPVDARLYVSPSADADTVEKDTTIFRGEWFEESVNFMVDVGLGFSFITGPVGVFGELRYLYMGPPSAADLDAPTINQLDNDPDPIQAVLGVIGVGFLP